MTDFELEANREDLSKWYFAALRKHMHDEIGSSVTPAALIGMDRQLVEMLIDSDDRTRPLLEEVCSEEISWHYLFILILISGFGHALIFKMLR